MTENNLTAAAAKELGLNPQYAENVIKLLDDGNTVPFIARYRKEMHGTMDDQMIRELADRVTYLRNLAQRKGEVLGAIAEQGKLTDELKEQINAAETLAVVEDLYRPYKQKRRTRAMIARERGLEPLAQALRSNCRQEPEKLAAAFVNPEQEVLTAQDALAGAGDIIAEDISDDAEVRRLLRLLVQKRGALRAQAATEEDSVYRLYYDYREPVARVQSHRVLAVNRGEKEKLLKVTVEVNEDEALAILQRRYAAGQTPAAAFLLACCKDSYERLIFPSVERETRAALTAAASEQAIKMFAQNLKPLLLQPPLKNRVVLGFDPAYRTGCKLAVVDATGKVLETGVVYPTPPHNKKEQAAAVLKRLILTYGVTAIAIGNGTASKESEIFVAELLKELPGVCYSMVNEAGASVYSASKLGAEEFPEFDVSLRSAVSIARRLQDPLAELVKIDPRSIGVGQYQHDMPQKRLNETLDGVVEDCVNSVGVDLNTASAPLLRRVAGVTAATAKNIVAWREEEGAFTSRAQLKKVKGLGPKAYEQCAGFLRLPEAKNRLDATAVHPESYPAAKALLDACGYTAAEIGTDKLAGLPGVVKSKGVRTLCDTLGVGEPTLNDIIAELCKPGRDVRDSLPKPLLRSDIMSLEDLKPGMEMTGTVRNVIDFGAFVDLGVHQDGLVHISQISDKFIKHPREALKVGDIVRVKILSVDTAKKRIALTMKGLQ